MLPQTATGDATTHPFVQPAAFQQYYQNLNYWQQQPFQQFGGGGAAANILAQQQQNAAIPNVINQQDQQQQQPAPQQQQRFQNIVQEEVENRDWLDLFYATSRLMVLVTLVYFYSSPIRCMIVVFFITLYYL